MKYAFFLATTLMASQALAAALPIQTFYVGVNAPATPGYGAAIAQLGFNSVRFDVPWKVAEPPGSAAISYPWDAAVQDYINAKLEPILILDYGNPENPKYLIDRPSTPAQFQTWYNSYAKNIIGHYLDKGVRHFEVWNEWNNGIGTNAGNGPPETYVAFVQYVRAQATRDFPNADLRFIVGSPSAGGMQDPPGGRSWLRNAIEGSLQSYITPTDGIGLHPYADAGIGGEPAKNQAEDSAFLLRNVYGYIYSSNGNKTRPIYITEVGWSTSLSSEGVTESEQALGLVRAMVQFRNNGAVKGVWAFKYKDGNDQLFDKQRGFGILKYDGGKKPAVQAIVDIAGTLKGAVSSEYSTYGGPASSVYGYKHVLPDGFHYVLWATAPKIINARYVAYSGLVTCDADQKISIIEVGSGVAHDFQCIKSTPIPVQLDRRPILIKSSGSLTISVS